MARRKTAKQVSTETKAVTVIGPQPGPQTMFSKCSADLAIFGGSAGGGKSFILTQEAARHVDRKGYTAAIFRRTYDELTGSGSVWETSKTIYPHFGGIYREGKDMDWRFPSGAIIEFSHLQHEKHADQHLSKEYAFIGFDELTTFTEKQFWKLMSRNRSTCGIRPYIRAATNPDPDSFVRGLIDWWIGEDGYPISERAGLLRWFIRSGDELVWADTEHELIERYPHTTPLSFTFIPSRLEDNKILMAKDPAYLGRLQGLPRIERERYLHGNWDIRPAAGTFFRPSYFELVDAAPTQVQTRIRAWDFAATRPSPTNPDPDYTAGIRYSRAHDGTFYIEHLAHFRDSPKQVEAAFINTASQDGHSTQVAIWQDPGQAGKAQAQHMISLLPGHSVKAIPATQNKVSYAMPVSSQAEAGNIKLVKGPWIDTLLRELEAFPDGRHDDTVDALSLAHKQAATSDLGYLEQMARWRSI